MECTGFVKTKAFHIRGVKSVGADVPRVPFSRYVGWEESSTW